MNRQKFSKPFDLCHSIMFNEFPETYTSTIGVPGKFVKKINRRVHLKDGTCGEMDSAYIADPDYKILFERAAVAVEHQSKRIGPQKLEKLGDYDIQLVVDEHLPTLLAVASHLSKEKSEKELIRTPSDITRPYFLDLGEENITKRLITVSEIINNNKYLNEENALNLGVIALYAPRNHARQIMKTVIDLYLKSISNLDLKMEYTLYSVIRILIDAYFDDENENRRLKNMIDEKTSSESMELFESHKNTIESLKYAKESLKHTEENLKCTEENLKHTEENLKHTEENLKHTEENLKHTEENLKHTEENLAEANDKIAKLEAENAKLKHQLHGK